MNRTSRSENLNLSRKRSEGWYGWKANEPEENIMNHRASSKNYQRPKSIREAGQEFLTHLLRHFENARPDVRELEAEEEP